MTPELFERARTLFLAAKRLDDDSRTSLLEDVCDGDAELRRLVDRLLDADAHQAASVLDEPVFRHPLAKSVDELSTPRLVGPYRVIRSLGSGSVGDVYLAERGNTKAPPVAIKVLRAGAMAKSSLAAARFEVERSALSMLSHRNIARIFDAGTTEEGRAFLVMEYISGERIDEYCRAHSLSRRSRLTLFLQLCDAVQHAHQRGVIHRDLKPANVLVVDEPWPMVKVVDFGIAKIIGDPRGLSPTLTEPGQLLGTFDYMSPEQLDPNRGQADARSDVFALGVLLYQLLTDNLPFGDEDVLARRARGALNSTNITPMRALPGPVRRDMETIVVKALQPDPEKRYPTPAHLAEDVRRHLGGAPVAARGPSIWYRGSKFLSRHPASTSAAVVLVGAILVVALSNLMWRVEVERERRVMRDTILQFMDSSFEHLRHMSGASESRRETVASLLAQTDRLLEVRGEDLELLECKARLLDEVSDYAYWDGDYETCKQHREDALAIRRITLERLPKTVERRRLLAESIVKVGDADQALGELETARDRYTEAMDIHLALHDEYATHVGVLDDLCWSYERLGALLGKLGQDAQSRAYFERRLALAMRLLTLSPDRALSHHNAAWAHGAMARLSDNPDYILSETYLALSHAREAIGREPDRTAFQESLVYALRNRAEAMREHAGVQAAESYYREYVLACDQLARANPSTEIFQRFSGASRARAAAVLAEGGLLRQAAIYASEALPMLNATEWARKATDEAFGDDRCTLVQVLDLASNAGVDVPGAAADRPIPPRRARPPVSAPAAPLRQDDWNAADPASAP